MLALVYNTFNCQILPDTGFLARGPMFFAPDCAFFNETISGGIGLVEIVDPGTVFFVIGVGSF